MNACVDHGKSCGMVVFVRHHLCLKGISRASDVRSTSLAKGQCRMRTLIWYDAPGHPDVTCHTNSPPWRTIHRGKFVHIVASNQDPLLIWCYQTSYDRATYLKIHKQVLSTFAIRKSFKTSSQEKFL